MSFSTRSQSKSAIVALSSNPAVRDRMIRALESCDCSTLEAQGGVGVLAHMDNARFDFAVIDSKLPDLDSGDVTKFMQQQNPNISYVMVDSATGKLVGPHQLADQRAQKVFQALKETEDETESIEPEPIQPMKTQTKVFEPLPGMV